MKAIRILIERIFLTVVIFATVQSHCFAQEKKVAPFTVRARIEPTSIMVGEPVKVRFRFDNPSGNHLAIQVGDAFRWCTFEVCKGDAVVSRWKPTTRSIVVMNRNPSIVLDLPTQEEPFIVLPSQVTTLPVGDYVLRLRTHIGSNPDVKAEERPQPSEFKTISEQVVTIPLSIKQFEEEQMKARVDKLYSTIGKEQDLKLVREMCYELGALPPEQAKRAWRTLLLDKTIGWQKRFDIARRLSTQPSKQMAETLFYVQFTDPIRDGDGNILTLLNFIIRMTSNEDPGLQEFIRNESQKHRNHPFNVPVMMDGMM